MLFAEIDNKIIRQYNGIENAIKAGCFALWNDEKIKHAFSFGKGTIKDFERFRKNNRMFCTFIETTEEKVAALFPEYHVPYANNSNVY